MVGQAGANDQGADRGDEEDGRTPAQRLAALERAVEDITAVVGPDGVVQARELVISRPTGPVRVTLGAAGGYATVELKLDGDDVEDTKVVLFAGRGPDGETGGGSTNGDDRPRLGAAVYGGGNCQAGIEIAQDESGSWSVKPLGEKP